MTMTPEEAVRYDVHDSVAVLTINFPPVNALGAPVRDGMILRLDQALADDAVEAIVVVGANDRFIAGADIREFDQPRKGAELFEIQNKMETSPKLIVVAIDGYALGGGLEIALAAPFRVAASRARLGLPEVHLGLLPGAGGTQRMTRLVGPEIALDLILSGQHIPAGKARDLGVVDEVTDGDVTRAAIAFAKRKVAEGGPFPAIIERTDKVSDVDPQMFADVRATNARKWKGTVAPFEIVNCIAAATTMDPREGLTFEAKAFARCKEAPSRAAQVYLFLAERRAAKVDGIDKSMKPRAIASVGVIGAGTMGGGIAMSMVNSGIPVKLLDATQEALAIGMERVRNNYATSVKRGSRSQAQVNKALGLIETVTDYEAFANCDLVIEAVFETMTIKHEVFGKLDKVCKPSAIMASNTSALDVEAIARVTGRPGDVIGMHFFSPANVMKLVEVVRHDLVSPETIVSAMSFARQIGKVPVLAGNCDGFIGNRILARYGMEGDRLLLEGATPWQIDTVLGEFGFPMGLYLMRDMAGLDVGWRMRQNRIAAGSLDVDHPLYNPISDVLCEGGNFGQKTGAGFYAYEGRKGAVRPETEAALEKISGDKGIERRAILDDEILWRILGAMVNEGADIVQEGVAQHASDIDIAYCHGYGFPKYRGGPMFWAEQQGLNTVFARMEEFQVKLGDTWKPSGLLKLRAEAGKGWDDTFKLNSNG